MLFEISGDRKFAIAGRLISLSANDMPVAHIYLTSPGRQVEIELGKQRGETRCGHGRCGGDKSGCASG